LEPKDLAQDFVELSTEKQQRY